MLTKVCEEIMSGKHSVNSAHNAYHVGEQTLLKHAAKIGITLPKTQPVPPIPKPRKNKEPDPAMVVDRTLSEIRHEIPPYRPAQINSALRLIWQGKYDEARTQLADLDKFVDRWDDRIKELRKCRNPGEVNIFIAKYQENWT